MTKAEFKQSKEYAEMMDKIRSYRKGFEFTLKYGEIPKAKRNALQIVIEDSIKKGILESIAIGLTLQGEPVEETYRRL